jgi:hypothetical protein
MKSRSLVFSLPETQGFRSGIRFAYYLVMNDLPKASGPSRETHGVDVKRGSLCGAYGVVG